MNKSLTGSLAIAAGIVLLVAGGGTLASWQGSAEASATSIQSGDLSVSVQPGATWQVKRGSSTTDITSTIGSFKMVPGDTIVYTVPFQTKASGTNLTAKGTVSWGGFSSLPSQMTAATSGTYGSSAITGGQFTVASGTTNGSLVFTLTWPYGQVAADGPATMNQTWNLGATTFTVEQTANGAS